MTNRAKKTMMMMKAKASMEVITKKMINLR